MKDISEVPEWMFGEKYLKPVRIFPDPFRRDPNILVLCERFDLDKNPNSTNHRFSCNKTMSKAKAEEPWFGMVSGQCWMRTVIHIDGQNRVIQVHRVFTLVLLVLIELMEEMLLKLITVLVFMPGLKFLEPMLK